MHIIPHNLLSDEHVWAHSCCLTPLEEKSRWSKRSCLTLRLSTWSRWRLPSSFLAPRIDIRSFYIYILFLQVFRYVISTLIIVTFISIYSVIIYVVFFGAYMRCTRLCPLKPGCDTCLRSSPWSRFSLLAQSCGQEHAMAGSTPLHGRPSSLVLREQGAATPWHFFPPSSLSKFQSHIGMPWCLSSSSLSA
jgi:hypothetical protein